MNLVPYMRFLQKRDVTFTVTFRLESVRRDGNQLLAAVGSDYGAVAQERRVDQVVVNHGTRPLDELYFALKPASTNLGAVDYDDLIAGRPRSRDAAADEERSPAGQSRRLAPRRQTDAQAFRRAERPNARDASRAARRDQAGACHRDTSSARRRDNSRIVGSDGLIASYNPRRSHRPTEARLRLEARSIRCGRRWAHHIIVDETTAHTGTSPTVIEPSSDALVDGASDPSAPPVRPASIALRRSGSTGTSRAA